MIMAAAPPSDRPVEDEDEIQFDVFPDQIRESRPIDHVGDSLPDTAPEAKERAMTGVLALLGTRHAHSIDRRDRPIHEIE